MNLYTTHCEELGVTFETLSQDEGGYSGLTVGSDDQIYVSYKMAQKIQVFNQTGGKAVREIQCDNYQPVQIYAMKTCNKLVVRSGGNDKRSVKLISENGVLEHDVGKSDGWTSYPSVGQDDSIIIGWVNHEESLLTIDLYTNKLSHTNTLIKDFKIQKPERGWSYLQEFASGELAFCTPERLYIFY